MDIDIVCFEEMYYFNVVDCYQNCSKDFCVFQVVYGQCVFGFRCSY